MKRLLSLLLVLLLLSTVLAACSDEEDQARPNMRRRRRFRSVPRPLPKGCPAAEAPQPPRQAQPCRPMSLLSPTSAASRPPTFAPP